MENEILDEIEDPIEEGFEIGGPPVYANKSFNQFLFSILVYLLIAYNQMPPYDYFGGNDILDLIIGIGLGILVFFLNLFGMINASKSERFQEKSSWKKYVGAVGNMLLFLPSALGILIYLIIVGSYVVDLF
ncbi:MAG: hypothetical protein AB8H03_21440 [Saprospiraceae bacterium]